MYQDIMPAQGAAQALVVWSGAKLSDTSDVMGQILARIEAGETAPCAARVDAIRTAFEAACAEFIAESGGGPGVRFQPRAAG